MGFFSVNKEVLPIGISLRVPIGTRSDGKLNLVVLVLSNLGGSLLISAALKY